MCMLKSARTLHAGVLVQLDHKAKAFLPQARDIIYTGLCMQVFQTWLSFPPVTGPAFSVATVIQLSGKSLQRDMQVVLNERNLSGTRSTDRRRFWEIGWALALRPGNDRLRFTLVAALEIKVEMCNNLDRGVDIRGDETDKSESSEEGD
jgi:hypothetical protein